MNLDREVMYIAKGGKLMENKWVYDEEKDEGSYVLSDITHRAIQMMFEPCELEDGVILKDVFELLNTELDIFDVMIGNWCKEIVYDGLGGVPKSYTGQYDPDEIEYLELYWSMFYSTEEPGFYGYHRPGFHGIGFELKEDKLHDWNDKETGKPAIEWPKGHRIPWSVCMSRPSELVNTPLKLNQEAHVYNDDLGSADWHSILTTYQGATYTLGNILQGIIWELSFHGSPENTKKTKQSLMEMVDEIKNEDIIKGREE